VKQIGSNCFLFIELVLTDLDLDQLLKKCVKSNNLLLKNGSCETHKIRMKIAIVKIYIF
jgi:hypothetical protein